MILCKTNTWTFGTEVDESKVIVETLGVNLYLVNNKVFFKQKSTVEYLDGILYSQNCVNYIVISKAGLKTLLQCNLIDKATHDKAKPYITYNVNKLSLDDLK